jgi:hypothetical protein
MARNEEMITMRKQGLKYKEIAEKFGVSWQRVRKICGNQDVAYFHAVSSECIYPKLRKWMNDNQITRTEFLKRMGLSDCADNRSRLSGYMKGKCYPQKKYIDKMLAATGLTYEELFFTGGTFMEGE